MFEYISFLCTLVPIHSTISQLFGARFSMSPSWSWIRWIGGKMEMLTWCHNFVAKISVANLVGSADIRLITPNYCGSSPIAALWSWMDSMICLCSEIYGSFFDDPFHVVTRVVSQDNRLRPHTQSIGNWWDNEHSLGLYSSLDPGRLLSFSACQHWLSPEMLQVYWDTSLRLPTQIGSLFCCFWWIGDSLLSPQRKIFLVIYICCVVIRCNHFTFIPDEVSVHCTLNRIKRSSQCLDSSSRNYRWFPVDDPSRRVSI